MILAQNDRIVLGADEPFPESWKTGNPDDDRYWDWFYHLSLDERDKMYRDERIQVLLLRASGHPVGISKRPELYAKFPELAELESAAEAMYTARQNCGVLSPPPLA